ncbi:helix-turn-helix transcriptional regulator [Nocardioides sp. Bht2]|uniref:helix-turn-helix transcriptional regulator n=1 Tax=Nocardioides sp. Bht2 TaxID=3392297 RepID=UPI0039B3C245
MASQHLPSTFPEKVDRYAVTLGGSRVLSDRCAYLFGMTRFSISSRPVQTVGTSTALEKALTIQELAAELRVTPQTLYDLRSQGRGPSGFRVGRHLRFRRSEIDAWLARLEADDAKNQASGRS